MARTSGTSRGAPAGDGFRPFRGRENRPSGRRRPTPLLRGDTIRLAGRRYVADLADGGLAELTLDPQMQQSTESLLRAFQVPFGAAVVVSVPDGRVLALVGQSAADPRLGAAELALRPWAPAASVFKVVSAAALVENGVLGSARTCYHGGVSSIVADNLVDLPAIDRRCDTLAFGLGKSQNAIIAKLATRHLTAGDLTRVGRSFGFDEAIPFDLPIEPSHLDVPADGLEFARTAAGFWHSTLSPMHGALLAAAIANRGQMPAPMLIDRARDRSGRPHRAAGGDPPSGRRRRGGARGGADDGADDAHRHGQGDVPRQARPALAARRGRGQDRHAVGRDRSRLCRLQLVRRLCAGGAPGDRVRRRAGEQPELADKGDIRRPAHRR